MCKQQDSVLDEAVRKVVDEVLDGQWSHSTTETLMRRAVEVAGLPEALFFWSDPETGNLYVRADPETRVPYIDALSRMLVEALADATFPIELPPTERHPNGEVIYPAAIHYVPAGGPDADTKPGVWVRFWDLCHEEVARIMAMHGWDRKLDNEPSS